MTLRSYYILMTLFMSGCMKPVAPEPPVPPEEKKMEQETSTEEENPEEVLAESSIESAEKTEEEVESESTDEDFQRYDEEGYVDFDAVANAYGDGLADAFQENGIDPWAMNDHFYENDGTLTPEMYDELNEAGFSDETIDEFK